MVVVEEGPVKKAAGATVAVVKAAVVKAVATVAAVMLVVAVAPGRLRLLLSTPMPTRRGRAWRWKPDAGAASPRRGSAGQAW